MSVKEIKSKFIEKARETAIDVAGKAKSVVQNVKMNVAGVGLAAVLTAGTVDAGDRKASLTVPNTAAEPSLTQKFEPRAIGHVKTIAEALSHSDTCDYGVVLVGKHRFTPRVLARSIPRNEARPEYAQYNVRLKGFVVDELKPGTVMFGSCGALAHVNFQGDFTDSPHVYKWNQLGGAVVGAAIYQMKITDILTSDTRDLSRIIRTYDNSHPGNNLAEERAKRKGYAIAEADVSPAPALVAN